MQISPKHPNLPYHDIFNHSYPYLDHSDHIGHNHDYICPEKALIDLAFYENVVITKIKLGHTQG